MLCTSYRIATLGSIVELLSTRPAITPHARLCTRAVQPFSPRNVLGHDPTRKTAPEELNAVDPEDRWKNSSEAPQPQSTLDASSPFVKESMVKKHGDSDSSQLAKMTGGGKQATSSPASEAASSRRRNSSSQPRTARGGSKRKEDAESDRVTSRVATTESKLKPQTWQIQKQALAEKFGEEKWSPRKRLSPDTLEGIRTMHASDPERFTTPILAEHFKVSPEAIRRILRSKWQPNPEEMEDRRRRWEARGERIWTTLAEIGTRPPKKWREMGVGKAEPGDMPKWKKPTAQRPVKPVKNVDIAVQPTIATRKRQSGPAPFSDRMM
jgi:hypothetical protein